jgi:hypothetical protein
MSYSEVLFVTPACEQRDIVGTMTCVRLSRVRPCVRVYVKVFVSPQGAHVGTAGAPICGAPMSPEGVIIGAHMSLEGAQPGSSPQRGLETD